MNCGKNDYIKRAIGVTRTFNWTVTTGGEAVSLEGRDLTLQLVEPRGNTVEMPFSTSGDVVSFTWQGEDQTRLGLYSLILWENYGEEAQRRVDIHNFVELMPWSETDSGTFADLTEETIELGTSDFGADVIVEDTLTSTSASNALSANMGRVLNEKKQDVIQDLDAIRSGAAAGAAVKEWAKNDVVITDDATQVSASKLAFNGNLFEQWVPGIASSIGLKGIAGFLKLSDISQWDSAYNDRMLPTVAAVKSKLAGKQDTIADLATIRSGAEAGATAVQPGDLVSINQALATIEAVIPSQASSTNKLTDKTYVDGAIATNTANFVGTFNSLAELQAVQNPTKNDYGFVIESDAQGNEYYDRYKYTGNQWLFEYKVESTPFTAEQWAAIQSGITAALVSKLSALPTNAELNTALAGKQPVINDLNTIRSGAAAGATAYQKPASGISASDMASVVQTTLEEAATDHLIVGDKQYNSSTFSGLGRINLEKNIVSVGGTDKNVLTQAMMNAANTIYKIQYDYDLNGQTITVPAGCVLEFDGGSLKNGTLNLNECIISSDTMAFSSDVTFSGNVKNNTIYTKWLSFASADDEYIDDVRSESPTDNITQFKQLQSLISDGKTIIFEPGQYLQSSITGGVYVNNTFAEVNDEICVLRLLNVKDVTINFNSTTIKALYSTSVKHKIINLINADVKLYNGHLIGFAKNYDYPSYTQGGQSLNSYEWHYGISQIGGNVEIHDMTCEYFLGDGMIIGAGHTAWNASSRVEGSYYVKDCIVKNTARNGITLHSSTKGYLSNITISDVGVDSNGLVNRDPRAGIDVEFEDVVSSFSEVSPKPIITLDNIIIKNCRKSITSATNADVEVFIVTNSTLEGILHPGKFPSTSQVKFQNCQFKGYNFLPSNYTCFEYCDFNIDASGTGYSQLNGTYYNCNFKDYSDSEYQKVEYYNKEGVGKYYNCNINFHKSDFASNEYYGCNIDLNGSLPFIVASKICRSSLFNMTFVRANSASTLTLKGCIVDSTCKIGNSTNRPPIVTAEDCTIKGNVALYSGDTAHFVNCLFVDVSLTNSAPSTATIDGCSGSVHFWQSGLTTIDNSHITVIPTNTSALSLMNLKVRNSTIEDTNVTQPAISSYTATIVAENSVFNLLKNYKSTNCTFTNCIVNSTQANWTEAGFAGSANKCIFSTPIPTIGATSARPSFTSDTLAGFQYFDTDLGKMIVWNGTAWVNMDGTALS